MHQADAACELTRWQHFSVWNIIMSAILELWHQIKNPTRQSMHTYLKNNPAKFHPDLIWNDGALGFLEVSPQQKAEQAEG